MLPGKVIAVPSPLSSDVADAVRQPPASLSEHADASDGSPSIPAHVRETLAQLGPGGFDRAGSSTRPVGPASGPLRLGPRSSGYLLGIQVSIPLSNGAIH
jgi:hypothetical protein